MLMKKTIVLITLIIFMFGCGGFSGKAGRNKKNMNKIDVGMDTEKVKAIAGEPDIIDSEAGYNPVYYYVAEKIENAAITKEHCMPIYFKESKVFAIGRDMLKTAEEEAKALAKQKEKMLYQDVINIPVEDYEKNYNIYSELYKLDPANDLYKRKRDYYEMKKKESDLLKEVDSLPADDFNNIYEIYSELLKLNPQSDLYKRERDYYEERVAEKRYLNEEIKVQSCYVLGYRYGKCSAQTKRGITCETRNDIEIPERCKNREDTQDGIAAGMRSVQ